MSFVDAHILDDQGGQQIGVRTDGKSPTLRAEMHGNVPCVMQAAGFPLGFRPENVRLYEETATTLCNGTRPGFTVGVVVQCAGFKSGQGVKAHGIGFEEERAPTLASESGGNSVPSVCAVIYDGRGNGDGETVPTLTGDHENSVTDYTAVVAEPLRCYDIGEARLRTPSEYIEHSPTLTARCGTGGNNTSAVVYCLQGNGIDRADTAGCNGKGWTEDVSYTLNAIDRPAVAFRTYQKVTGPLMANSHPGSYTGQDAYQDMFVVGQECAGVDCRNMNEYPELYPTLQAKPNGGQSLNFSGAVRIRYIVRRLTPTECARLQGFPDQWGHPDHKADFTDEEYRFWHEVRNTHAEINGKAVKEYSREQMLKWYNGLHTDSAEYKLWGNGIALPCALYVMQGIADALEGLDEAQR